MIKGKLTTAKERRERYRGKHPDRVRKSVREYTQRQRMTVIELLGRECIKCGFSDIRALQVDHINGGGMKELRKGNGSGYFNKIIRSISTKENKYQLLCANCNWIKRFENNETRGIKITEQI